MGLYIGDKPYNLSSGQTVINGKDGVTFKPVITEVLNGHSLSWQNNGGLPNPASIQILNGAQGPSGPQGTPGQTGPAGKNGTNGVDGKTPVKGQDYFTNSDLAQVKQTIGLDTYKCTFVYTDWVQSGDSWSQTVPCKNMSAAIDCTPPWIYKIGVIPQDEMAAEGLRILNSPKSSLETLDGQVRAIVYEKMPDTTFTINMARATDLSNPFPVQLDDNGIHEYSATVIADGAEMSLSGNGSNGKFLSPSESSSIVFWSVNGERYTAQSESKDGTPSFKANRWITFTLDKARKTINFKSPGGSGVDLSLATATPADVASGKTFYAGDETLKTGVYNTFIPDAKIAVIASRHASSKYDTQSVVVAAQNTDKKYLIIGGAETNGDGDILVKVGGQQVLKKFASDFPNTSAHLWSQKVSVPFGSAMELQASARENAVFLIAVEI